uniref:Yippee domain-containing protein n=1 Tax=Moschus moschiferus TaxID=68415 RepID=A0A8C6EAM7_MOSMO
MLIPSCFIVFTFAFIPLLMPSCHRTYSCIHCRAHLASHDELISKLHVRSSYLGPSVISEPGYLFPSSGQGKFQP